MVNYIETRGGGCLPDGMGELRWVKGEKPPPWVTLHYGSSWVYLGTTDCLIPASNFGGFSPCGF